MKLKKIDSLEALLTDAANECIDSADTWWIYAASSDKLLLDYWDPKNGLPEELEKMKHRLLELRIFSEKAEYKAFRGDIGHELRCRKINDEWNEPKEEYFDEIQYLDINLKDVGENGQASREVRTTTGGGPYNIPMEDLANACVIVRNYLSYSRDRGQAYIYDFRLVKLDNIKMALQG